MKKTVTFLLSVLIVMAGLVGCSAKSDLEGGKPQEKKVKIGLSISTLNNPFFVTLKEGAEKAAQEAGAELIIADAQDDTAKQANDVEDLIQKQVDILLINPTDSQAVASIIESANQAEIPVITVDREAEGGNVLSHIASDNVEGGKMAGEYILEQIENEGTIVELEGIPGTSAAHDRGKGFHEAIDREKGVQVVASQPANFDRAKGLSVMENILQSQKEITAIFAHNDEMALGAVQAIQAANQDILVVGFDATDDAVKAVKEGSLAATIAQRPADIGKMGVEVAVKAANGEKVESFYPVELEMVTKP
ncbi:ribose ABC transporter substrate-binding protein RbsB [Desmospora profundinema]|nr:ribose ABC transporter substrate-binding protein RbsB [Desmospora profundinema]